MYLAQNFEENATVKTRRPENVLLTSKSYDYFCAKGANRAPIPIRG